MFKIIRKCPKNYFQKFGSLFQNSQYYRMLYLTLGLNKYNHYEKYNRNLKLFIVFYIQESKKTVDQDKQ